MLFLLCLPLVVGERGDTKDCVCEAPEQVFGQFPKHHLKILLRIVKAMLEKENIFKYTVWFPQFTWNY